VIRRIALLLLALAPAGCVRLQYTHAHVGEPLPPGIENELRIGTDRLGDCLRRLGAPTLVYGDEIEGISLAWAWTHVEGWGLNVSYSFSDFASVSASYDDDGTETWGLFLTFDADLVLRSLRRARLSEVAAASIVARRRTPASAGT
jgi:hypothetical protein